MNTRRCSFCMQEGHNRRSCDALSASEGICETLLRSRGCVVWGVGTIEECECNPCNLYRLYNVPTPQIACQILKDKERSGVTSEFTNVQETTGINEL